MPLTPALKDATNHILSHAETMRAVITMADEIERIGGLENLAAEAESRKGNAGAALGKVEAEIKAAQSTLDDAKTKTVEAKADAKKLVDDARTKAQGIIADAQARVAGMVAEGEARAAKAVADVQGDIDVAKGKLDAVNADIATAQASRDDIAAETADLVKRADAARAYLAKLAEG